jgi:hypothetical protein
VQQVALALTGWTYVGSGTNNWENFSGPMVPRDVNHDLRAKAFLGCSLPAGQTAQQDLNATLDCIFAHPNVGPFIGLRLIRQLVKSNPSPAYVRGSAVFNNNGSGTRGDLKAVVRAMLTDPRPATTAPPPTAAACATRSSTSSSPWCGAGRQHPGHQPVGLGASAAPGRAVLSPPSVFGFYSPLFRCPQHRWRARVPDLHAHRGRAARQPDVADPDPEPRRRRRNMDLTPLRRRGRQHRPRWWTRWTRRCCTAACRRGCAAEHDPGRRTRAPTPARG